MADREHSEEESRGRDVSSGWLPEPGSGWSAEDLDALVRDGVPVVRIDSRPRLADGVEPAQGAAESMEWVPEQDSGWSAAELEALVLVGVPVVGVDAESRLGHGEEERAAEFMAAAGSRVDELAHPEHGPVSWLAERAPSGGLLSELESLPAELVADDHDSVEMVALWAGLESYCAAGKRTAAAAMARRESLANGLAHLAAMGIEAGEVSVAADELSVRLGISKPAAAGLVRSGRAMNEAGIPTGDALAAGDIEAVKADLILEAITDLGADAALAVQERVLPKAPHLSTGQLRREVAAACAAVDPEQFEQRCADAVKQRRVGRPRALPHGMASLYAVMPAVEATQVYRAVDAAARSAKNSGDPRTMDQLRADALAAMGLAAVDTGWIGPAPTESPQSGAPRDATVHEPPAGGVTVPEAPAEGATMHEPPPVDQRGGIDQEDHAHAPSMRVGHIGGGSAHVRVVVPYTILMDQAPGPSAPIPPPDVPEPDPPPDPRAPACAPNDDDTGTTSNDWSTTCLEEEIGTGGEPRPVVADRAAVAPQSAQSASGELGAAAAAPTAARGVPARQVSVPDQLAVAFLEGYGPIPASAARALAAGSTWSRLVLDPIDRTVLEVSSPKYRPPESMARLVRAAQPYCAAPTCNVSSDSCDLNHRIPHPVGATTVWNLDPDCRRDHLLITHGGWNYEQDPELGGPRTWTTATGHVYEQRIDGEVRMIARRPPARIPSDDTPPPF